MGGKGEVSQKKRGGNLERFRQKNQRHCDRKRRKKKRAKKGKGKEKSEILEKRFGKATSKE